MDSRERVFLSLNFEEPDRVPVDFWGSEGFYRTLRKATGLSQAAFLDRHDVDFRYIEGPRYVGPPPAVSADGTQADIWGVPRRTVRVPTQFGEEAYKEVASCPLAGARSVEDIEAYAHWPSPDWFDYSVIQAQCDAVRSAKRVAVFMGDRLNRIAQLKPAMYLRGVEQSLLDLAESPEITDAVFRQIRRFYCEYLRRILESAGGLIDIVLTGDDFGAQNGPLLSPALWRRHIAGGFAEYVRIIREHKARAMHHTCGSIAPLVPDMVECGLQILQSLQPEAMAESLPALKRRFGGRLGFHGGISIQRTLPRGSKEEIYREVRERMDALGAGGGYIFCTAHNVQADCSVESVETLLQAYREIGQYRF